MLFLHFIYFILFIYYLFNRARVGGVEEREGDRESEAVSRLWAVSTELDEVLELMDCEIMTWAEVGCLTD